jgi:hypothetical protein
MRYMKKTLFSLSLGFLLTSGLAYADSVPNYSIDCSNSSCLPNFTVLSNFQKNDYNSIDAGSAGGNITVSSQSGQSPWSLRMNVVNGAFPNGAANPGYGLTVNLKSTAKNADAGNVVVLGDNFSNLDINLNGYSGKAGKDASTICAENIKANLYGPDALSFFTNFRLNNPGTPSDRCSLDDLNFLQSNKFKCDSGFTEDVTTNSVYSVNVDRIPKVNRCQTSLSYDVCLRKKVLLSCNWKIYNGSSSITGGVAIGSNIITNAYTIKGNLNGTKIVTTTTNISGVTVGQSVIGNGIPANTQVEAINGSSITISNPATTSAINASLFTGVSVGQFVFSPAFASGAVISDITGSTITVSKPSTVDNSALTVSSSTSTNYSTAISRKIPENQYTYLRNLMSDADVCNLHVAQEVSDPSYTTPAAVVNPIYANPNSHAGCSGACSWKVDSISSNLTTPGLNGDQPASGTDWDFISTTPGNHCDTGTNPTNGFFTTYKTVTVNYVAYDVTNAQCNANQIVTFNNRTVNLDYPAKDLDPNLLAVWFYTGAAQEPDFGTETVQCDLGNCPVASVVSDLNQTLDTITPQDGESGSKQGTGLLLIYDAQNITTTSNIGVAGAGGKNDIINQASTRVCSKKRDAATDGLNSDYARNPIVNFNRYNWTAIKTSVSGNPGQQPVNIGATVTVWKKIDSSVRAFLQNELF